MKRIGCLGLLGLLGLYPLLSQLPVPSAIELTVPDVLPIELRVEVVIPSPAPITLPAALPLAPPLPVDTPLPVLLEPAAIAPPTEIWVPPTVVWTEALPTAVPAPASGFAVVPLAQGIATNCPCDQGDVLNCADFNAQGLEAQACYQSCLAITGRDVHSLDADADGDVCESNR